MITALALITGIMLIMAQHTHATVQAEEINQLNLNREPLDVVASSDGQHVFILVKGQVLVYSLRQNRLTDSIPVEGAFDSLTYATKNNTLVLSSSTEKKLRIIRIEIKQDIDITGHPFRGPAKAPVTIAVFSDYQ